MLKLLCKRFGIPFYKKMLSWSTGKRDSDGIWGKHWYGQVEASTGFHPYIEKNGDIPSKYQDIFLACMESYQQLYSHRLK